MAFNAPYSRRPTAIKGCVFHFEFEMIHPFSDGNGRMGRLWHTLLLSQWNKLFLWLPVESVIRDRQREYYAALNRSDAEGNAGAFTEFMLDAIKRALTDAVETGPAARKKSEASEMARRGFVLDRLTEYRYIMNADVCKGMGVSPATANRILNRMCADGTLKRIRVGKHWAYAMGDQTE